VWYTIGGHNGSVYSSPISPCLQGRRHRQIISAFSLQSGYSDCILARSFLCAFLRFKQKLGVHAPPKTKKRRIATPRAIASFAEDGTDGCEDINPISIHPPMALSEKQRNQLESDMKGAARLDDILNSPPSRTPNLARLKNIQSRTSPANKRTWGGDGFEAPPVRHTFRPPTGPLIDILPTLSQSQVGQLRQEYKSIFKQVNVATHIKTVFPSNTYGGFGKVARAV